MSEPIVLAKTAFYAAEASSELPVILDIHLRVFARAASKDDYRLQISKADLPDSASKPAAYLRFNESSTMRFNHCPFLVLLVLVCQPARGHARNIVNDSACSAGNSSSTIMLRVGGLKRQTGIVNIWIYGSNPRDFLARDKRILRLAYPVPRIGPIEACIALPGPGRYAIAAHHDVESNDKRDISDGLGFSGNPRLSVLHLKPTYAQTSFVVGRTTRPVNLVMLYRSGLSIKAVEPQAR